MSKYYGGRDPHRGAGRRFDPRPLRHTPDRQIFVRSIAKRVVVLHEGSVIAEGDMDTVQKHSRVIEVYLGV